MTSIPDPSMYSYPGSSPSGVPPYDPLAQGGYQDPVAQAGYAQPGYDVGAAYPAAGPYAADQKSKVAAGLLGIFLGCFDAYGVPLSS
ncbi:hypothetical protein [uncultured Actinomyces sp.]|mgnify:CR=1 FL=1|uniref:hypothetical protein n=1 Tax=uncultured Actinomyces sp. TaxID=249061 RepID=UPI00288BDC67|nr:hypothetical protein [uncultured Actinomyces sp.]